MTALLTEKATAPWWAGLRLSRTRLLNKVQKTLSALLARRLRRAEAELLALDDRILKGIGLNRSELGSLLMDYVQQRTSGVRQNRLGGE